MERRNFLHTVEDKIRDMNQSEILSVKTSVPKTREWYDEYYTKHGAQRNSLLHNPEVLFQVLAQDAAIVRGLQSIHVDPMSARVLDVGCGEGPNLWLLLRLGFLPANLFGIDVQEGRILRAKAKNPLLNFECMDAAAQKFPDQTFSITMESTLFIHLTDDHLARQVALEMIRVTKLGGNLILTDWRYPKPGNPHYKALSKRQIADIFQVGIRTRMHRRFRGPLLPPIGRFLSAHCTAAYFPTLTLFPFLAGQFTTVLERIQ